MKVEIGKVNHKGPKLLWIILLVILTISSMPAQISPFSIKKYGQKIEENFHTIRSIRQDSLHRLLADQWIFDGHTFFEKDEFIGERFYTNDAEQFYVEVSPYKFLYIDNGAIKDTIDVSEYTDYPNASLTNRGDTIVIINAHGLLFYKKENEKHTFLKKAEVPSTEVRHFYQIKDTLFFKDTDRTFYVTKEKQDSVIYYGKTDLSHFPTFYLPGNRIVLNRAESDTIIGLNSPWWQILDQFADDEMLQNMVDARGRLWLSLRSPDFQGIYFCLPGESKLRPVQYADQEKIFAYTMYEDHQGSIWAGTDGSGLYQIHEKGIQIIGKGSGLKTDNIWSVQETREGNVLLTSDQSYIDILTPELQIQRVATQTAYTSLLSDNAENLWLKGKGAMMFDDKIQLVKTFAKPEGLYSRSPACFFQDSRGIIWVGTRKCLHRLDNGRFIQYPVPDIGDFDLIFNIIELHPGQLLIATKNGHLFEFSDDTFKEINNAFSKVNRILKDMQGNIWLASQEDGLLSYKNGKLLQLSNLPSTIYQIQYDAEGSLWGINSENEVFSIPILNLIEDKEEKEIKYYDNRHGLPLIDLNIHLQPSSTLLNNGNIVFPNIYGGISINPTLLVKKRKPFKTIIGIDSITLLQNDVWELPAGSQSITMQLTPITLLPNHPVEYAWQKDGNWIRIENYRQFSIDHLNLGENHLTIKGRYLNHGWQDPMEVQLIVLPQYYQTIWFKALVLLSLGLIMYSIILWRTKMIKDQNLKLQAIIDTQTSELKNEKEQLAESLKTQKSLTRELKLNQISKNRMYAQISHEFKSPLQAVKSHLTHTKDLLDKNEKKNILENLNTLIGTSNEILELSKAESGQLKSHKNWYNINSIIEDQIQLKQPLLRAKNIEVNFDAGQKRMLAYIDFNLMHKVLNNLLSNAIKFSPQSSKITIKSLVSDKKYHFSIRDEGIGIVSSEIENITSPYVQGSNNNVGGTGIGLSFANEILKLHDSYIQVESELGKGSTFSFELSIPANKLLSIPSDSDKIPTISEQLKSMIIPDKLRILCVDDNREVLRYLNEVLQPMYYTIIVEDATKCLEEMKNIKPHLIISDVNMPMMDGLEFLKAVRNKTKYKTIPFMFLTGSASEETKVLSLNTGADVVLQKPINTSELTSQIKRALSKKKELIKESNSYYLNHLLHPQLQDDDEGLLLKLEEVIVKNIQNAQLKSQDIAQEVGVGEKTLRNKIKSLTGLTIREYLKMLRMEIAQKAIKEGVVNYSEIASATGFSSLSYFRKSYKSYFKDENQ